MCSRLLNRTLCLGPDPGPVLRPVFPFNYCKHPPRYRHPKDDFREFRHGGQPMAEPIRNPQPFPNQQLDTELEHSAQECLSGNNDPAMLASEAAAERIAAEPRGKVVE